MSTVAQWEADRGTRPVYVDDDDRRYYADQHGNPVYKPVLDQPRATTTNGQTPEDEGNPHAELLAARLLGVPELRKRPAPEPLIDGVMTLGTLAVLWGRPGSGKSVTALDWSLSIATKSWWFGREVAPGSVLYVAAEGVGGLLARVDAWMEARRIHQVDDDRLRFLPGSINLLNPTWGQAVVDLAGELRPVLVVVDTLARCMHGGDENSSRDMGVAVEVANCVQQASGATVLVVHHDTKAGDSMRGSSALLGACDTSIECRADGQATTLRCEKSKDAEPFTPIRLWREVVGQSCVLAVPRAGSDKLTPEAVEMLRTLDDIADDDGVSSTTWRTATESVTERTYYRWQKRLVELGLTATRTIGSSKRYTLTDQGRDAIPD